MGPIADSPKNLCEAKEIGGYPIVRTLVDGQSWLVGSQGRQLVLKILDDDCLWKGQLHPAVKDRLARVRELAHTGVANLHGVERDAALGLTYLVWDYVEGRTLVEVASSSACSTRDFLVLIRELVLSIDVLHARGIIHGSIRGGANVIITPAGSLTLTHISPLLWSEVEQDIEALLDLIEDLLAQRGQEQGLLAHLVRVAREQGMSLRQLASRIGALIDSRDEGRAHAEEHDRRQATRHRRRAVIGAVATALVGMALFGALRLYAQRQMPRPVTPVTASSAAMQPEARKASSIEPPAGNPLPQPQPSNTDPVSKRKN